MNSKMDKAGFAERLHKALDKEGFPPKNKGRAQLLAEIMGITKAGTGKWLNGLSTPSDAVCQTIAAKLTVNDIWLLTGQGDMLTREQFAYLAEEVRHDQEVPFYKLENLNKPIKMIRCTLPLQGEGIAFSLKNEAMEPRFPENTVMIVDTKKPVKNGDFVLVKICAYPIPIFRQLLLREEATILVAHHPKFSDIQLSTTDHVLGVMVQAILSFC